MFLLKTLREYSENSSVHGVGYIFENGQHFLERLVWVIVVFVGVSLATFFSVEAYLAWGRFPVITSVSTTSLPIRVYHGPALLFVTKAGDLGR